MHTGGGIPHLSNLSNPVGLGAATWIVVRQHHASSWLDSSARAGVMIVVIVWAKKSPLAGGLVLGARHAFDCLAFGGLVEAVPLTD